AAVRPAPGDVRGRAVRLVPSAGPVGRRRCTLGLSTRARRAVTVPGRRTRGRSPAAPAGTAGHERRAATAFGGSHRKAPGKHASHTECRDPLPPRACPALCVLVKILG